MRGGKCPFFKKLECISYTLNIALYFCEKRSTSMKDDLSRFFLKKRSYLARIAV